MPKLEYPGFTGLSDQVLFRAGSTTERTKQQTRTVIIYGWGDGQARHVAKYADGFQRLFPSANQIVVLSPISRAMWQSLEQRSGHMTHVVKAAFPSEVDNTDDEGSVLVHIMSNTGAIFYGATLHAYREAYNKPLPAQLVVLDSTPGSTDITLESLPRFSRAMALGTAAWFPWPFVVTQCLWATFLVGNQLLQVITGTESAPVTSLKAFQNPDMQEKSAKRLYLYSKEDQIILWSDIEKHIAESREQGWQTDAVVFEGSGHVGHMRLHAEKYWNSIQAAWIDALAQQREP